MKVPFTFRVDDYTKEALEKVATARGEKIQRILQDLIVRYLTEEEPFDLIITPLHLDFSGKPSKKSKKVERLAAMLQPETIEKLKEVSKATGQPASSIIRRLILREYKKLQDKNKREEKDFVRV